MAKRVYIVYLLNVFIIDVISIIYLDIKLFSSKYKRLFEKI